MIDEFQIRGGLPLVSRHLQSMHTIDELLSRRRCCWWTRKRACVPATYIQPTAALAGYCTGQCFSFNLMAR